VPLLTLGLPTTATAAIILSAFQTYGIRPGPQLFETQAGLVWALIASLYIGNVMLLVLNLPLVGMWVKVLRIPRPYLYAGILSFAALGAYALHFNVFDTLILLVVGLVGFLMRRYGYPVAPMVVGGILGPMAEEQLRKSMAISQGDLLYLVHSPFAIVAYGTLAVIIGLGIWLKRRKTRLEATPTLVPTGAIAAVDEREPEKP
jgi:putative tricarboxylic transport membrane protein